MSQNRFFATALAAQATPALRLDTAPAERRVPVQVLCGWDRPLKYFFLQVETHVPLYPELEVSLFDNLRLPDERMSIEQVMSALERLGIAHPAGLREQLAAQQRADLSHDQPEWDSTPATVETLPERLATVEAWRLPDGLKWTGKGPVPALGERVTIHVNKIGAGTVQGYFHLAGFLGVLVDVPNLPDWYCKGQATKPFPHVYGRELEPYG